MASCTSIKKNQLPPALIANLQGVLAGRKEVGGGGGNGEEEDKSSNDETQISSSGINSDTSPEDSKPIVLVTNSDGIGSPGLSLLVEALVREGEYAVSVCAPESDKFSSGHSVTFGATLAATSTELNGVLAFEVSGTPADCVSLALSGALFSWSRPVLVICGINKGRSSGHHIYHSGAIAGAREALMSGIPSLSISLNWRKDESQESNFKDAVDLCLPLMRAAIRDANKGSFPKDCLVSIEIPASPSTCKGFKVAKQSLYRSVLNWQAVSANRHPYSGQYMSMHQSLGVQLAQLSRDASAAGAARRVSTQRKNVEVESVSAAGKPEQRETVKKFFRLEFLDKELENLDEDEDEELDFRAVANGFLLVPFFDSSESAMLSVSAKPQFFKTLRSKPTRFVTLRTSASVRCSSVQPPRRYRITLLPGDGIGPEVVSVAKDVLALAGSHEGIEFKFCEMPLGGTAIDNVGVPLPVETLNAAKESDAVLLGAIGGYKWDKNAKLLKPETGLLHLRRGLGVFANLRPAVVLPQLIGSSTLKMEVAEGVDLMVIRELTGGIYFGEPRGFRTNDKGEDVGFNTEVYSASEVDRIARVAFKVAQKRRGKLCSVDKANVLEASIFWRKRVNTIALEFPDVLLSHMYVDNAAMQLIREPRQFDTILTNNIFGDILSDEASMLTGSIGMLPSASISESGPGLFEPIHGSAPDIAGQDKANPLATILSAAMLLQYGLGEDNAAKRIEDAVIETLNKGFRTGDIHSSGMVLVGCKKMGEEVLKSLDAQMPVAAVS
ncbi:hypothetical protein HPP92_009254 [Vanilla planifolia]|uniref:3-isopropylmalate dehydrogenase n=1 Tax=Vanilla planifolia TaxID=51239 RepID=A0A835R9Y9_VANPL|nr:hypothetical protein HPP92_009254 [Vanilla planifolia]